MHKIVTISRHIAHKIVSFQPELSREISIIHHGIDLDTFKSDGIKA